MLTAYIGMVVLFTICIISGYKCGLIPGPAELIRGTVERKRSAWEQKIQELQRDCDKPLLMIVQEAERKAERAYYTDHPDEKPKPAPVILQDIDDGMEEPADLHAMGLCDCAGYCDRGLARPPVTIDPSATVEIRDDRAAKNMATVIRGAGAWVLCDDCQWEDQITDTRLCDLYETVHQRLARPCHDHRYWKGEYRTIQRGRDDNAVRAANGG